ncbi:MAG: phage holin family protein [Candidatus Limnocylindrales bacterium]
MKGLVLGVAATAIAFAILTLILPEVRWDNNYLHLAIIAILFGIVNGLVKPVVKLLSFPINLMTMGLFGIVINVVLFMGVAWVSDAYLHFGFTIHGWPKSALTLDVIGIALIASIVLGILTAIIGKVVKD